MNRVLYLPLCFLSFTLWLAACTPATPPQTTAPTVTTQLTSTISTEVIATTPLPTETILVTSTLFSSTNTPNPTETATTMPTLVPTLTNTPPPTSVPPSIEGALFFFWDTETPLVGDAPYSIPAHDPIQDLYIALPGKSPVNWQTTSLLRNQLNWPDEAASWPTVSLSPDQSKLAFTIHKRIDINTDVTSIYVANLFEGTISQIIEDNYPRIFNISWLPDSQTVAYSMGTQGFLTRIDNNPSEQFTPIFPSDIIKLKVSPDGQLVAITLQSGELILINLETNNLLPIPIESVITPYNIIWSPDSAWLVLNQVSGVGLSLIDVQTNEHILIDTDFFGNPSWSPNGSQLVYMKGTRDSVDLYIWDSNRQTSNFIVNQGHHVNLPVWSLQSNYLAIGFEGVETTSLLIFEAETGEIKTLTELENVQEFVILSWSPDERWILLFGASENQSCLYLVDTENGSIYCAVDATGTVNPFEIFWVPPCCGQVFLSRQNSLGCGRCPHRAALSSAKVRYISLEVN